MQLLNLDKVKGRQNWSPSGSFSIIIYCQQTRQTGNTSPHIFTGVKRLHVNPAIKERRQLNVVLAGYERPTLADPANPERQRLTLSRPRHIVIGY
jgi:hypothetical protein